MGGSPSTAVGGEPQNHKKLHGFVLKTKDNRRHDDPLSQNRVSCVFAMSACEKGEQWGEALQLLSGLPQRSLIFVKWLKWFRPGKPLQPLHKEYKLVLPIGRILEGLQSLKELVVQWWAALLP